MMLGMLSVPVRTCFVCPILNHESPAPHHNGHAYNLRTGLFQLRDSLPPSS
jgi:hypothetical protein